MSKRKTKAEIPEMKADPLTPAELMTLMKPLALELMKYGAGSMKLGFNAGAGNFVFVTALGADGEKLSEFYDDEMDSTDAD